MIADKLRKSILQAAIQGKLTEQLLEDGDARDLLSAVKAEKVKLIAEGKIKKEKPLPEITEDETPFDIPDNWQWSRLGDIVINKDAERKPVSKVEREGLKKEYDYYGASGVIDKIDGYLFSEELLLIGEDGANLINRSTPIAFIAKGKYWVNNHAHVLQMTKGINIEYLCYYVNAISLSHYVTGTAQPKMNQQKMNSILVSIPPLREQERIVERLKSIFPEISKLQKDELKLALLQKSFPKKMKDSLLQAAIQGKLTEQLKSDGNACDLVAEIQKEKEQLIKECKVKKEKSLPDITGNEVTFDIPANWCWVRVNKLTLSISAGGDKPKDFLENKTDTHMVPVIANGIQNEGIIGYTQKATITEPCITISGRGTIGFSCVRTEPFMPIVRLLVLNVSNKVIKKYIQFVFTLLLEKGVGTSIPQLTVPMLEPKLIPLPPLAEQQRIVERLEQLLPLCDTLE